MQCVSTLLTIVTAGKLPLGPIFIKYDWIEVTNSWKEKTAHIPATRAQPSTHHSNKRIVLLIIEVGVSSYSHVTFLDWPYMLVSLAYTPISDIALAWENEEREEEKKEKKEEERRRGMEQCILRIAIEA